MQCVDAHGERDKVPKYIHKAVHSKKPNFAKIAHEFAGQGLKQQYLLQTSKAVTVTSGGIKVRTSQESTDSLATLSYDTRTRAHS